MKRALNILCYLFLSVSIPLFAQDISLFEQFNGRYDYLALGNTLNPIENNGNEFCTILESSSAELFLNPEYSIVKAYLYWAGSGSGDPYVTLNGESIEALNTYTVSYESPLFGNLIYFSCYSDITEQINLNGNGTYTLSDIDINSTLVSNSGYCLNRTNFGGWGIYIIYEDTSLPLNQISLFQGLEIINRNVQNLEIELTNINVLDNLGAKIGFLAWEGDNQLNFGESLAINGNIISNPPLNLADNAFNGTNSFTNSTEFFNADLDVYNIENNIAIGDTSATIQLTTGDFDADGIFRADLIIMNNIITVLNSRLPDATISIVNSTVFCGGNTVLLDYTVFNINSTEFLPANTPIAFYLEGNLIGQTETTFDIAINASENGTIELTIPEITNPDLTILAVVDDDGTSNGVVSETNESNNWATANIQLLLIPDIIDLPNLVECNQGLGISGYNLFDVVTGLELDEDNLQFFRSIDDLETLSSPILDPQFYTNTEPEETIYIRRELDPCYEIYQFQLLTENCPPRIPQGFSPNNDTVNDWFNIQGLYDIFLNHELQIYNRYGELIFKGNNDKPWSGTTNRGLNARGRKVPVGTYYYILYLNDSNYRPMVGWVYVNY